ncbi:EndoU domain-containing protein [Cronbergia sp. UHCC 0137]|uniref:EndoU domain-containing protein n=1 Tax=Cronbergia sp. UHCC 0137 TaxID=3110239 RepID=UPI002B212FF3|nr:EndoU domain-containing protein [Cronbergia sp. UHCC 0137]MEA5621172.1 EndoU domain-containing protein [Cronbergia sp. UHCC 0137]
MQTNFMKLKIFAILLLSLPYSQQVQAQQNNQLLPFFDNLNNPGSVRFPKGRVVDITPPAPQLNSFDQAVLQTCGSMGTRVTTNKFKQLLSSHPNVLDKIQKASGGELSSGRNSKTEFLEDLSNIWFKRRGFEHIFCGEIKGNNGIGGLHFHGRYLQLQNQGIAGRLANNQQREEVIPGVIYTMGVVIKQGNRTIKQPIKGYSYVSNAEEILLAGTKAFKRQGNQEGACIYSLKDQETGKIIPSVFVRKERAIVTFYPDATPKGTRCKD